MIEMAVYTTRIRIEGRNTYMTIYNTIIYITCMTCLLILTGCDLSSGATHQKTIVLEKTDPYVQVFGADTFTEFDGKYPAEWPAWLILPQDIYLLHNGAIVSKPAGGTQCLYANGVQTTSAEESISYFTKLLHENNIEWNLQTEPGNCIYIEKAGSNIDKISIIINDSKTQTYKSTISIRVYLK